MDRRMNVRTDGWMGRNGRIGVYELARDLER